MKKQTKNQAAKRRAKKLAQRRADRKPHKAGRLAERRNRAVRAAIRKAKALQAANLMKDGESVPDITDDEYVFWLCHGANFLASDEATGAWEPIFEDIYAEGTPVPAPEVVAQRVMDRYSEEIASEGSLSGVPQSVLAWSVTEKSSIRIYKFEAERRLTEKDPECDAPTLARQPHNPAVWGVMIEVKERTLAIESD
jgi:hypothetical protein